MTPAAREAYIEGMDVHDLMKVWKAIEAVEDAPEDDAPGSYFAKARQPGGVTLGGEPAIPDVPGSKLIDGITKALRNPVDEFGRPVSLTRDDPAQGPQPDRTTKGTGSAVGRTLTIEMLKRRAAGL
jgi:hypothetical protein